MILGLVWLLILRFQIGDGGGGGQQDLLDWCNSVLNPQGLSVSNFKDSWQDGRAFCGLVNALEPDTIDLSTRTPDQALQNLDLAFDKGSELFDFFKILDAQDVMEEPDDLSIMTYVSFFRGYMKNNSAYAPNCYAEAPGLTMAVTGKPGLFTIQAVNQAGEKATTGKAPVRCKLTNEAGEEVAKVTVVDKKDGTYSCQYVSMIPGKMVLHICIRSDPIKNAPYHPEVLPGEPSPAKSTAEGDGLTKGTAGVEAKFVITAVDVAGNKLEEGGTKINAVLKDPTGDIPVTVVDNGDGTYNCSYTPKTSGPIPLEVIMETEVFGSGPIAGSPFTPLISPSNIDPANTTAEGPGLLGATAGEPAPIKVQARDKFGNKLETGGDPVNATLEYQPKSGPPVAFDVKVTDNGNGTYDLSYVPEKVGSYELKIKVGETPIKDMPVQFTVLPGRPNALNCEFDGLELDSQGRRIVIAGKTDNFKILAKDGFGNQVNQGGLSIDGKLGGTEDVPVMVNDSGDGTYAVSYTPKKAGPYQLNVTIDGQPMGSKNPFPLLVIPAEPSAPHSTVSGDLTGTIGKNDTFTIHSHDKFENPCTMGSADVGGELTNKADPSVKFPIHVEDNNDGTYTCSYPKVTKAGVYDLVPTIGNVPVKGAPFQLTIKAGATSPTNTIVELDETQLGGKRGALVHLCDEFGNKCSNEGDKVTARLKQKSAIIVDATDNGDGTYDTQYPAGLKGKCRVDVLVNSKKVPNSPWEVNVAANPVPETMQNSFKAKLPQSYEALISLLQFATPAEREALLKEISSK